MLIDTHCHLLDDRFDCDREQSLDRARKKGVCRFIEIACLPSNWQKAVALARANQDISCAVGLHPQDAKLLDKSLLNELKEFINHKEVVGIGETGLDYYHENTPRAIQKTVFLEHLNIAKETNKPLVLHCRDAYKDLIEILRANSGTAYRGVVHCFSSTKEDAKIFVDMGFYIGIDGPITYPKALALKEAVYETPIDRILIETDSPYLPPQEFRGKRNEPAYLTYTAEEISRIKNIPVERVAEITTENAVKLFNLELK